MADHNVAAVFYAANLFFQVISERLVALAARHRIPAVYEWREFVTAGGLMAYGANQTTILGGPVPIMVDKILKGEKPSDLPVERGRLELFINLRTAKTLGIAMPLTLLGRADEVIE